MFAEIARWIRAVASAFAPPRPCPVPVRQPGVNQDSHAKAQRRKVVIKEDNFGNTLAMLIKKIVFFAPWRFGVSSFRQSGVNQDSHAKAQRRKDFFKEDNFGNFVGMIINQIILVFFAPWRLCVSRVSRVGWASPTRTGPFDGENGGQCPPYGFTPISNPQIPKSQNPSRSAFTLIEMLIVISIMLMLVALMATVMSPATEARRTREAARMVNVYLSTARNRAMETGRPCGVIFRNFNTDAGAAGFAMNADQCEVPPCFAGYSESAMAKVTRPNINNNVVYAELTEGPAVGMIRRGDVMQFNGQGPYYAVADDSENAIDTNTGYLTGEIIKLTFDTGQIVPWTTIETLVPYRIFRSPMKGAATPLQLPAGAVVDLYWSGEGNGYIGMDNTLGAADLTILFSPHGSVESIYYGQTRQPVTQPIYLLIGLRERVGTISDVVSPTADNKSRWMNWQDLETGLWVTINPNTGVVGTEPVGSTSGGMPVDVIDARGLAAQAQGMGGR